MTAHQDERLVGIAGGKIAGVREEGVHVFRGVPYARSTGGAGRFRSPRPVDPWTDTLDATRFGPVAPQLPSMLSTVLNENVTDVSEDCLTLNVWTPGLDDAHRPVMVWIHGGAFVMGTGSTPWYDGTKFATAGDVVVVTINYRLGAFGFCFLDDLGGSEFAGSGNAGILDQVAALEWVRENIEAFGGDPGSVTIFGESAGAMSVGTLLGTPSAQGLFHRAILQSGAASYASTRAEANAVTEQLVAAAGVDDGAGLVALSTAELLEAQRVMLEADGGLGLPFRPVADGVVLPAVPLDSVAAGTTGAVPTLIGSNLDEMTLFLLIDPTLGELDGPRLTERAGRMFGPSAAEAVAVYTANRPDASPRDVLVAIASDGVFRVPAIRLLEAELAHGRPAYSYLFTWATPVFDGALGSTHALELPFVFDNLDQPGAGFFTGDGPGRAELATVMHEAWIRFARTGDPGWPAYDLEDRTTQVFDGVENPVVSDPMGDERALWAGVDLSRPPA